MQFISTALVVFIGIFLTGFDKAHWFLYLPVAMFLFAGLPRSARTRGSSSRGGISTTEMQDFVQEAWCGRGQASLEASIAIRFELRLG